MTRLARLYVVPGFVLALVLSLLAPVRADDPDDAPPPGKDGATVLTHGPIHEAFAQPSEVAPAAGPVVPRQPPDPIPEMPPDTKPDGDNVVWIPGYWAYDGEPKDFLWVSGVWRVPPPDRKWVPGAWNSVTGGWQWTRGFWAPEGAKQMNYLQAPPGAPPGKEPSSPPPNQNSYFAQGNWVMGAKGYVWKPGFWAAFNPGWLWTPPSYYATPAGYLFVDGFWDYPLEDRGTLFAPATFNPQAVQAPGFSYQPSYSVSPDAITNSLFVGPGSQSFNFGNYYGPSFQAAGYKPWFDAPGAGGLFNYYRWHHRDDPGWEAGLRRDFRDRFDGRVPRPARTLAEEHHLLNDVKRDAALHHALHTVGRAAALDHHVPLDAAARRAALERTRQFHDAARDRAAARAGAHAGAHAALALNHRPAAAHPKGVQASASAHVTKKAANGKTVKASGSAHVDVKKGGPGHKPAVHASAHGHVSHAPAHAHHAPKPPPPPKPHNAPAKGKGKKK